MPTTDHRADSAVDAFVRIRPLTRGEGEELPAFVDGTSPQLRGFTGVLGSSERNQQVFEICLEQRLSTVLSGGAVSLFSYGYTGGGKTHTIVGYGEERGLYFLAAEQLLVQLNLHCVTSEMADQPFLRATACEIYGDRVYDLLGPEKIECSLRMSEDGQLQASCS